MGRADWVPNFWSPQVFFSAHSQTEPEAGKLGKEPKLENLKEGKMTFIKIGLGKQNFFTLQLP